mgnify:CR=1 FL=1
MQVSVGSSVGGVKGNKAGKAGFAFRQEGPGAQKVPAGDNSLKVALISAFKFLG